MAKKYVNGYDKPTFRLTNPRDNTVETIALSFKYQALTEYYEKISISHKIIDGSKIKKPLHIDYEWRLFYDQSIEKDDLIKIGRIENAEFEGKTIRLTPHSDYPWREFDVLVLDEKREIDLMPHGRGRETTMNKGFIISFVNKSQITQVSLLDPDFIPAISCEVGFEFE